MWLRIGTSGGFLWTRQCKSSSIKRRGFLTSWVTVTLSRTLLHGVSRLIKELMSYRLFVLLGKYSGMPHVRLSSGVIIRRLYYLQEGEILTQHSCQLYRFNDAPSRRKMVYVGVSKSYRTGRLERELQMVQLSATRCYFVSQSSEFCRQNPLCCFSTNSTKGKRIRVFRYRFSPESLDTPSYQRDVSR
jgi:hypothetical protein